MTLLEFWSLVDLSGGDDACWPWKGNRDRDGYGIFHRHRSHRFAFQEAHGVRLLPSQVVRHACDNPPCCNPKHFRLGTQLQNVADRVERDRSAKGVGNGRAKLTELDVLTIFTSPLPVRQLASIYDVSPYSVHDIKRGRNWGWLTGQIPTVGILEPNDALVAVVSR